MTPDQELKKLLEKKAVQLQANYKVLICRYYRAVCTGYHKPEIVAERFDRYVRQYGIEAAEKKLTARIFNFGRLRGHHISLDGWTRGGIEREQAAIEARAELPEIYKRLAQESKELRATLDALEEVELRHVHQTWWKDVRADTEAAGPAHERSDRAERERLGDTHRDQATLEDRSVDARDRQDELRNVEKCVREEMEHVEEQVREEMVRRGR